MRILVKYLCFSTLFITSLSCDKANYKAFDSNSSKDNDTVQSVLGLTKGPIAIKSIPVDTEYANQMIRAYGAFVNYKATIPEAGISGVPLIKILHPDHCDTCKTNTSLIYPSFKIDVKELRRIIDREDVEITDVLIYPGVHTKEEGGSRRGTIGLLVVGSSYEKDASGNYKQDTNGNYIGKIVYGKLPDGRESVLQFNFPCPPPPGCHEIK